MKLSLNVLKNYLLGIEEMSEVVGEETFSEWINNNIGDEDVSVREWLDVFKKYWNEVTDDYGDSEVISDILENVYKLSKEDVEYVMKEYWG